MNACLLAMSHCKAVVPPHVVSPTLRIKATMCISEGLIVYVLDPIAKLLIRYRVQNNFQISMYLLNSDKTAPIL